MEPGMNLGNPDDVMHQISTILHGDDESTRKANLWAYIAAHVHTVEYDYKRVTHFIEFINAYQLMQFHCNKWVELPSPDPIEYLDILEFTSLSLNDAVVDKDLRWNWPTEWGPVSWNSNVMSSVRKNWNQPQPCCGGGSIADAIRKIDDAIIDYKRKLGHRKPLLFTPTENLLISEFLNMFGPIFGEIPLLPEIYLSLDKPKEASLSNCENMRWDTDGLLGEYLPGVFCEVLVYERGLQDCAKSLGLPKLALRELTIVHEIAHWASDQIPMHPSRSISSRERWSDLSSTTSGGTTTWHQSGFETADKKVHEGWAQLLCFYTLLMAYNDRNRCSIAAPSLSSYAKRDGRGCLYTFMELNQHQSMPYRVWKDILALQKTPSQVISTLRDLRTSAPGVTLAQWESIVKAL